MKRYELIYTFFLLSLITPLLVSCGDDDLSDIDKSLLTGRWYHSYATNDNPACYIFYDDHTGVDIYNSSKWDINWSLENGILYVTYKDPDLSDLNRSGRLLSLTEDRMHWDTDKYGPIVLYRNLYDCVGYGGSSSGSGSGNTSGGVAPTSIAGKIIYFYKDMNCATEYFNAEHYASGGVLLSISSTDYQSYPPSYSYSKKNSSTANYTLSFTTKTFVNLYKDYIYSPFRYEMVLTFSTATKGTYKADYYNTYGLYKTLEGAFIIK